MRVTKPMIDRAYRALNECAPETDLRAVAESVVRAALNDTPEPDRPLDGQTSIGVDRNGNTVVVDG